jgi:hypothetical protein
LLSAPEKAKAAYRAGKLTPQVWLLIARIPNSKVAEEATERILKGQYGEPLSFRQVQNMIASDYMTQLKAAPFDPKDAALVPDAGPCAACLKRTGNQKETELFADVGRADVCTDPVCFRFRSPFGAVHGRSEKRPPMSASESLLYSNFPRSSSKFPHATTRLRLSFHAPISAQTEKIVSWPPRNRVPKRGDTLPPLEPRAVKR